MRFTNFKDYLALLTVKILSMAHPFGSNYVQFVNFGNIFRNNKATGVIVFVVQTNLFAYFSVHYDLIVSLEIRFFNIFANVVILRTNSMNVRSDCFFSFVISAITMNFI